MADSVNYVFHSNLIYMDFKGVSKKKSFQTIFLTNVCPVNTNFNLSPYFTALWNNDCIEICKNKIIITKKKCLSNLQTK